MELLVHFSGNTTDITIPYNSTVATLEELLKPIINNPLRITSRDFEGIRDDENLLDNTNTVLKLKQFTQDPSIMVTVSSGGRKRSRKSKKSRKSRKARR